MTTNNKGRAPGKDATPKTTDSQHSTATDPLIGWFSAAMRAKLKVIIVRLAVWGLIPASFATWLIQHGGLKNV